MKISKNEYDELMSMLDFFSYKIDPCYKRETDAVAEKYRENFKRYIAKDYYPDAAHDISRSFLYNSNIRNSKKGG